MPPIIQPLLQHRTDGVFSGRPCAGLSPRPGSPRRRPTADSSFCFIPSKAQADTSFHTRAFFDLFLVSSRMPLSLGVMGAAYSAYILIYPD